MPQTSLELVENLIDAIYNPANDPQDIIAIMDKLYDRSDLESIFEQMPNSRAKTYVLAVLVSQGRREYLRDVVIKLSLQTNTIRMDLTVILFFFSCHGIGT